jgi:hypothetical protein
MRLSVERARMREEFRDGHECGEREWYRNRQRLTNRTNSVGSAPCLERYSNASSFFFHRLMNVGAFCTTTPMTRSLHRLRKMGVRAPSFIACTVIDTSVRFHGISEQLRWNTRVRSDLLDDSISEISAACAACRPFRNVSGGRKRVVR